MRVIDRERKEKATHGPLDVILTVKANNYQVEKETPNPHSSFPRCMNGGKINFREKEKQILDQILGPGRYDARIRPSGINGTGEQALGFGLRMVRGEAMARL